MLRREDVRRIHLGRFVRPPAETGTGQPRVEDAFGYLVRHEQGLVLLDTGIGEADEETEAWYRPRRVPLPEALAAAGHALADVSVVVNCHLHFDHCGGNPLLAGRPIVCQRRELETARTTEYTVPGLVDHPGVTYEELDGDTELLPGLHVMPTPGHVDGHQSLVVHCGDGTVVLAGQSHETASDFAADVRTVAAARGHRRPAADGAGLVAAAARARPGPGLLRPRRRRLGAVALPPVKRFCSRPCNTAARSVTSAQHSCAVAETSARDSVDNGRRSVRTGWFADHGVLGLHRGAGLWFTRIPHG